MNALFGRFDLSQDSDLLLQSLPRPSILVVVDGEDNASITEDVMREINADVIIVKDSEEAIALCLTEAFSVILYDIEMRSKEGVKIVEAVVQNELTRDIPIILLSQISESDQLNFSRYKTAPIDYLSRPVAPHILISRVNVFLSLQIQRLAILRLDQNRDLNQTPTGAAQDEIVAPRGLVNSAAENVASDVAPCSQRMDGITRLSAVVAHDFNNILAIILGNLELLSYEDIQNSKVQTRLSSIQNAAERACTLTNQLLGISSRAATKVAVTNVNGVLTGMKQLILTELSPAVTFTSNLYESLWQTSIDPDDFQEATLNLILNAREAMPDGGQLVLETANISLDDDYCSLNPDVEPGDYVAVSVTDTGHGIAADSRPFVFDPFFSSKDEAGSKGMGLPQVYGFCHRSKGHVRLQSGSNVGTTAHLYLPRTQG
jgi:signal transduction histidine kinase